MTPWTKRTVQVTRFLSRTFLAFSYRDYRLLWTGAFTSSVGTWMQKVAQNWLVLTMTGSAFLLGLDAFLGDVPFLLFSLFGGVLADRADKRKILILSQLVQMSSAFLLTVLILRESVSIWMILALSFVVGFAQSFGGPAFQALVPTLVSREAISNAVAFNSIQFNLARVVGPVLAGYAFHFFGPAACMALNGASFLAVIAALLRIKTPETVVSSREPVLQSLKAGLSVVWGGETLRQLVLLAFAGSFLAVPLLTFLPVVARERFALEAKGYGGLLSAFGLGAVTGALAVAATAGVKRKGLVALSALGVFGALTLAFSLCRNLVLAHVLLYLAGLAMVMVFAEFMTLVQTVVEDSLRGRVVSVYTLAFRGAMPLGNLVAGAITKLAPATWVLAGNGILLMTIVLAALFSTSAGGVRDS